MLDGLALKGVQEVDDKLDACVCMLMDKIVKLEAKISKGVK
jgi:hypothetical protein